MARQAALRIDNRRATRLDVALAAELREPGRTHRFAIALLDLSVTGFRCETGFGLVAGQTVFVTIPTFGALEATVIWRTGTVCGCEFARALYGAVFDHIVARHRKV